MFAKDLWSRVFAHLAPRISADTYFEYPISNTQIQYPSEKHHSSYIAVGDKQFGVRWLAAARGREENRFAKMMIENGDSVNENGDESGLRVEFVLRVDRSRRRSRKPKWTVKNGGEGQGSANSLKRQMLDKKTRCQLLQSPPPSWDYDALTLLMPSIFEHYPLSFISLYVCN